MSTKIIGVIPARLGSTRLLEKVLRSVEGRPMIQHVWEKARQAKKLHEVIVACDDPRIRDTVQSFGGKAVMTRPDHTSGTSRVAEIAEREAADIFLNIQGDEPLMHPAAIDRLAEVFLQDPAIQVGTLAVRRTDPADYENPNVVKVVCDEKGNALYFSRAPIPYFRDGRSDSIVYWKHLGIYGYRRDFLLQFVRWGTSELEHAERLEQLRILEKGFEIRVVETPYDSLSVDTEEDLEKVEGLLKPKGARPLTSGPGPVRVF